MKRTALVLIVVLSTTVGAICWPRLTISQEQKTSIRDSSEKNGDEQPAIKAEKNAILTALGNKASLSFDAVPLKDALDSIKQNYHLDIQLDHTALKDAGIDPSATLITLTIKDVKLRSALRLMLAQYNLTYMIDGGALLITTKEKADTTLNTLVYDARDLITQDDQGRRDFDSLIDLLVSTLAPQSWSEEGGPATIQPGPLGTLIVSQTDDVHEQITWLLDQIRKAKGQAKPDKFENTVAFGSSEAEKAINKALLEKVTLDFQKTPLKEAIDKLRQQCHMEIQLDIAALKDADIDPQSFLVSVNAKNTLLRSALRQMLGSSNLRWVTQNEALWITTSEKSASITQLIIYPVGDLCPAELDSGNDALGGTADDVKTLEDALTSTVAPTTWNSMGGLGTVQSWGEGAQAMLMVSQSADAHEEIVELLGQIRQVHRKQQDEMSGHPDKPQEPEKVALHVYPLRISAPNAPAMTPQEVAEVVKSLVEPKSWGQPDVYIRGVTGKLVVQQFPHVQRKIGKLLDQLDAAAQNVTNGLGGTNSGGGSFSLPDRLHAK